MANKDTAKGAARPEASLEGGDVPPAKKKMAGKTLILFIVLPALLVIGGGAAAIFLLGGAPAATQSAEAEAPAHGQPKEEGAGASTSGETAGGSAGTGAQGGEAAPADASVTDVGYLLSCAEGDPCYYVMPKLIVNLAGVAGQRSPYMELELTLESSSAATFHRVPELMPRLKNQLSSFLRELRVEDLNGSNGTWRLRRELLNRFNTVLDPTKIDAVLVESMLIQ